MLRVSGPHSVRLRATAVVWLLGLALALVAVARRPSTQIRALAWAPPVVLAAREDGALLEITADLHQVVAADQVVARFDPAPLTTRSKVLEAELAALSEREIADRLGQSRRFERDSESAELELAGLSARVQEGEAELRASQERLSIAERLVSEGVAPAERANAERREMEVVRTRLAADRSRLDLARQSASRASNRAKADSETHPWQRAAAELRLAEIAERLDRLALRSSTAGQITEIYRSPGEWLEAGDPVLRISQLAARKSTPGSTPTWPQRSS